MGNIKYHRGRFQAQGNGTEKSVAWKKIIPITKDEGNNSLNALKNKLTPAELSIRIKCFNIANKFISRVPSGGVMATIKHPCVPFPPYRDVRVDIEVLAGIAFID